MNLHHQKNWLKNLVTLIGIASAGVCLSFPALASLNPQSSRFDGSLNNRTLESNRQLLAQGTSGTGQTGTNQTGTSGASTCQISTGGTSSNNQRTTRQQNAFTQYMNAGYAATQQRNYPNALACFQRALQLRPSNSYATQAIQNVQGYMQRNMQGGATTGAANQGATTTAPNQGGTAPMNQGGTAPMNQGGTAPNQGGTAPMNQGGTAPNQGGNTTAPTNQGNP
ncbi:MAG TPA: tetratricopeptide repeat protein [Waterburya sp.]